MRNAKLLCSCVNIGKFLKWWKLKFFSWFGNGLDLHMARKFMWNFNCNISNSFRCDGAMRCFNSRQRENAKRNSKVLAFCLLRTTIKPHKSRSSSSTINNYHQQSRYYCWPYFRLAVRLPRVLHHHYRMPINFRLPNGNFRALLQYSPSHWIVTANWTLNTANHLHGIFEHV